MQYQFIKENVNLDQLNEQIRNSAITVALDYTTWEASNLDVFFKGTLDSSEELILNSLVDNHVPVAIELPAQPVTIVEQPPFAKPDYRTKHDATPAWVSCEESASVINDFLLTEERYVSGGELIYTGVKKGDYFTAEIYDTDMLIPLPYRTTLCENHPSVATYIVKKWLRPVSENEFGSFKLDTYPLNAKITAGLYLRITLHTSEEVGTRSIVINYSLTKKL